MKYSLILLTAVTLCTLATSHVSADKVIMKDGTVYKGKILIDTDKAILIGNPPFDPNSYLLESKDIQTIVYEEYRQPPPAERRRGFHVESHVSGNVFSGGEMSLSPSAGIYAGAGFRVHPAFELTGGWEWLPSVHSGSGLNVQDTTVSRTYQSFFIHQAVVAGRIYPWWRNMKWVTEPFLTAGYRWSRLIPKGSGDSLHGAGWQVGAGAIRPLTKHLFLETQAAYQKITYDTVHFHGTEGTIQPEIAKKDFSFSAGLSYRF